AGRKIAIMRGWQINGSERQRHRIAFNGDGGGGLVLQGGNGVMLMGFGCPAWPRTCDAQDHRHDESNHASSGFVVDRRSDRHFFDERDAGAKGLARTCGTVHVMARVLSASSGVSTHSCRPIDEREYWSCHRPEYTTRPPWPDSRLLTAGLRIPPRGHFQFDARFPANSSRRNWWSRCD